MLGKTLRLVGRLHVVMLVLALTLLFCEPSAKRYGDKLQVALPLLAWGCAALNKSGAEFATRFFVMTAIVHGSKSGLGAAQINQRPQGGTKGFPSAHTAAAAFGASSLVYDCITAHPAAKAAIVISAAFVGASRIEARRHDIWQVFAGAILGWGADRSFRRAQTRLLLRRRMTTLSRGAFDLCQRFGLSLEGLWPASKGVWQRFHTKP